MEEEKEEEVVNVKETKKSKSWGRRSTRAKKYISYRYVSVCLDLHNLMYLRFFFLFHYLMLFLHDLYSFLNFCRFDEFDEAIEEAIEEDIKEAEGGGRGAFPLSC